MQEYDIEVWNATARERADAARDLKSQQKRERHALVIAEVRSQIPAKYWPEEDPYLVAARQEVDDWISGATWDRLR